MPIYEYVCPEGHRHEEITSEIKSWSKCPVCGKRAKHVLSPPAIRFHGTGFYTTDYGRKGSGEDGNKKRGKEKKASGS